jgi:hypothetical protein
MPCNISKGIALDCSNNTGGIAGLWIASIEGLSVSVNEVNGSPESTDGTVLSVSGPVYGYANIVVTIPGATFNHLQFDGDVTSIYTVGTTVQFTADLIGGGVGGFSGPITASTYSPISGETVVNIGSLTTFQMLGSVNYSTLVTGGNVAFYKYEFLRNGASFEQPSTISLENGSTFYTHNIQFAIPKQDLSKRNKFHNLIAGQKRIIAVVKDLNGQYWLSGVQSDGSLGNALQVSTGNATSGKAKGDMNGYDYTLSAELNTMAFSLNPAKVNLVDGTTTWA